jgi:hypothetical protein
MPTINAQTAPFAAIVQTADSTANLIFQTANVTALTINNSQVVSLANALPVTSGGTGSSDRQTALDNLAGAVTSGSYLRGNGTDVVMSAIQSADVPTLNQNTTGTAGNVTGIVAIANGGTGSNSATFSGANITSLNASNISSGTIATARLATGTANSTTYLRGDQTWATVTQTRISGGTTGLTPNTLTGGDVTLAGTLAVANGGTGTASPSLVGGTNITISGSWPNQTVTAASGAPTTAQVLSATAGATTGAVGTYAWLGDAAAVQTVPGGTRAGSDLWYAGLSADISWSNQFPGGTIAQGGSYGGQPSGTWRAMGLSQPRDNNNRFPTTMWLRIS